MLNTHVILSVPSKNVHVIVSVSITLSRPQKKQPNRISSKGIVPVDIVARGLSQSQGDCPSPRSTRARTRTTPTQQTFFVRVDRVAGRLLLQADLRLVPPGETLANLKKCIVERHLIDKFFQSLFASKNCIHSLMFCESKTCNPTVCKATEKLHALEDGQIIDKFH